MIELPTLILTIILACLIVASAYFSSSETAMMSLNRYRLKHLSDRKYKGAQRVQNLLARPDRLIGLILLGNNFVNILAAMIVTILAERYLGMHGLLISSLMLTAIILVFAEVIPKTVAAIYPERVAFPSSVLLRILMFIFYPLVWVLNKISNGILAIFGLTNIKRSEDPLSREELRTIVKETGGVIPHRHRQMLFGILDLENASVEDIMIPRTEMHGINLEDEWSDIREQIMNSRHTYLPCYSGSLAEINGILHVRKTTKYLGSGNFTLEELTSVLAPTYFIPNQTDLYSQLLHFQTEKEHIAFVVDEYGDIEGLVTLDDILEEIIGEFTTDPQKHEKDVTPLGNGMFMVDGSANIREINRAYHFELPEDGPKTLNGFILETLEDIPTIGTAFRTGSITIEILQTRERSVKSARLTLKKAKTVT